MPDNMANTKVKSATSRSGRLFIGPADVAPNDSPIVSNNTFWLGGTFGSERACFCNIFREIAKIRIPRAQTLNRGEL